MISRDKQMAVLDGQRCYVRFVAYQTLFSALGQLCVLYPNRHLIDCYASQQHILHVMMFCVGVGARLWWRYAIRAVQRQQQHSNIVWRLVKMVSQLRKKYVPAYVRLLQQGKVGGDENIAQMDEQLDEHVIRLFRYCRA